MRERCRWKAVLAAVAGLLGGVGVGLWIGWVVAPVEYVDTDIAHLSPVYREEWMLMASEAYAVDGNLDVARARMALLALPDPPAAVADLAEKAASQGMPLAHIQALARLAVAMGAQGDALRPFLPAEGGP